jgi:excisionase family DNA binding protein
MEPEPLFLTIPVAARRLGIGTTLLRKYIRRGDIRLVKLGRCSRIPALAVTEFAARQAAEAVEKQHRQEAVLLAVAEARQRALWARRPRAV